MKRNLNEELEDMYYLLGYDRNKILSEQSPITEMDNLTYDDMGPDEIFTDQSSGHFELPEADMPSIAPSKPGIKTPTKQPNKPGTPYKPKVKPAPKAKKSVPEWLSFDELGINFE
jgi:hypothetical protein